MELHPDDFLQEMVGGIEEGAITKLQPTDRVAHALLVLARVLERGFGHLTLAGTDDGLQPGCLEKIAMVLSDELPEAMRDSNRDIADALEKIADGRSSREDF